MPPSSENIEALLCAYIEGELDETGRAEIERYLQGNPQHRKLIDELMQTRDMMRELPRATAPGELAESLRGHMERSLLLGDTPLARDTGTLRIRRWPQLVALAAVFVLLVGLAALVYQVVIPTFRPPKLTQLAIRPNENPPAAPPMDRMAAAAPDRSRDEPEPAKLDTTVAEKTERAGPSSFIGGTTIDAARHSTLDSDSLDNLPDAQAIKQRLSGSGISLQDAEHPVVLVVSSFTPTVTSNQITQYLDTNKITWEPVPAASSGNTGSLDIAPSPELIQKAAPSVQGNASSDDRLSSDYGNSTKGGLSQQAPQQTPMQKNSGSDENQVNQGMTKDSDLSAKQLPAASTPPAAQVATTTPSTTQPSQTTPSDAAVANGAVTMPGNSDNAKDKQPMSPIAGGNLYVARGMTREQAQQLRANLSQESVGQQCRVYGDLAAARELSAAPRASSVMENQPTTNPVPTTESTDTGRIVTPTTQAVLDRVDVFIVVQNAMPASAPTTLPVGN